MRLGKGRLSGSIAYSPDGTRLAVASEIGIWLYDTTTHQEVALLTGHASEVTSVAFSPDGQTIASANSAGEMRLWDANTGEHKQTLRGRRWRRIESIAFSSDGQTIASASSGDWNYGEVRLWDANIGEHKQTLHHTNDVYSVAFSPDGQTIASASSAGEVRLWDARTGEHKQTLAHTYGVASVAFSPDGQTIASANSAGEVRLWDANTGAQKQTLKGHTNDVYSVAFSPDGQTIASASRDYTVRLWNARTGAHKQTLKGHTSTVHSIAFSPDEKTIASASRDHTVRLWNAHTGEHKQTLAHTNDVYSVAFSPDGQTIASASGDHTVRLWNARTGAQKQTLKGHTSGVTSVAFSPDGQTIASASGYHIVRLWSAIRNDTGLWSASGDHTVRLWDANTGAQKQTLDTYGVLSVAFSPDGKTLASASWGYTVELWDANTGEQKQTLDTYGVLSVAFSPDGKTLASTSGDFSWWSWNPAVRLWDARTGEHKQTLRGHTYEVLSVAFSPDGRTLASASGGLSWWHRDPEVRLWDARTGEHKQTLDHTYGVHSVAFSPDGKTLAGASSRGTILLWDIADPPVDMSIPLGFAVEQWSSLELEPVAMDFIANPEYGTGIMGATIRNTASDDGEVLLWRFSTGGEELIARIPAPLVKAVPTVRFGQTGVFDNKLFVAIYAGPVGQRTTRVVIVEPNGEFRDAINIYNGNSTQASIEFSSPAGAYIYGADGGQGQSFYRLDESFNLHPISSHPLPSRSDIDPIDLKFDPTGKYGGLLTISDTDLNHDELSGLYQLQADGEWQTLVPPTPVSERQFQGIAFSNAGPLGSALYVADAVTDNIYVVSPKGVLEAFAVGFTNPRRVVIGPEGADMWVADQTGLYRIFSTDPSDWEAAKATLPVTSSLEPNYPNPFNSSTQIPYRVSAPGPVRLAIYNVLGQPVRTLVDEIQAAGAYQVSWDGRDHSGALVANGLYLCRLQAGAVTRVRKMMVLE
ncbi:MAG: T9SS type A sorting domain-containing protein [Gemmatimonadota bacterium]|nr:T9SS type A sorting domain-containing protein [Gemmatimonadota bacterium]